MGKNVKTNDFNNGNYEIHDSGDRDFFNTGAKRHSQKGKGRYDLIPPLMLIRLAILYEKGAEKYGDRNWEKGIPLSRLFSSTIRHMFCWLMGMRNEDHLAAAIFNIAAMIQIENDVEEGKLPKDLGDAGYLEKEDDKNEKRS